MKEIIIKKVETFEENAYAVILAAKIQKQLEAGKTLEQILADNLAGVNQANVSEDAAQLTAGIESVYAGMEKNTDPAWVQSKINSALVKLNNNERVEYLSKVIHVVLSSGSGVSLEEEDKVELERVCNVEKPSNEDVAVLVSICDKYVDNLSILFQRATVSGVMNLAKHLSEEKADAYVQSGAYTAISYAAANYIQMKCGKNSKHDVGTPAFMIGNTSAAVVENSKIVAMYVSGKIVFDELVDKTKNLFKVVLTNTMELIVKVVSHGLPELSMIGVATMTYYLLEFIGLTMYLPTFCTVLVCLGTGSLIMSKVATPADIEEMLRDIANTVKQFIGGIEKLWDSAFKTLVKVLHKETEDDTVKVEVPETENEAATVATKEEVSTKTPVAEPAPEEIKEKPISS